MSHQSSLEFWARRRADRTGCTLAQALELEELVAEEYDGDSHNEYGPDNDDWIHVAYLRQAEAGIETDTYAGMSGR